MFFDTPADYYYAYHSWDADSIFFIEDNRLSALSMSEDERYNFLVAEHYKKFYYGMTAEAVELESFVDFISCDWEQKEISSHFKKIGQRACCDLFGQLKPHS